MRQLTTADAQLDEERSELSRGESADADADADTDDGADGWGDGGTDGGADIGPELGPGRRVQHVAFLASGRSAAETLERAVCSIVFKSHLAMPRPLA